jgi:hypothetical protein
MRLLVLLQSGGWGRGGGGSAVAVAAAAATFERLAKEASLSNLKRDCTAPASETIGF